MKLPIRSIIDGLEHLIHAKRKQKQPQELSMPVCLLILEKEDLLLWQEFAQSRGRTHEDLSK